MGAKTAEKKTLTFELLESALLGLGAGFSYYLQCYPAYALLLLGFFRKKRTNFCFFLFYSLVYWGASVFLYHLEPLAFFAVLPLFFLFFSPLLLTGERWKFLSLGLSLFAMQTFLWGFPWVRTAAVLPESFFLSLLLPATGPLFLDVILPLTEGKPVLTGALLLLLWIPFNPSKIQPSEDGPKVVLLQNKYSTLQDWSKLDSLRVFYDYAEMCENERRALIVFPETSFPGAVNYHPRVKRELERISLENEVLFSTIHKSGSEIYNAIYLFSKGKCKPVYFKRRLVPYGEVVPFRKLVRFLNFPWGDEDFSRGKSEGTVKIGDVKVQTILCYESIFPNLYGNRSEATVVSTNDSWFGDVHGMWEHALLTITLARSFNRPVYQSSTNGLTFVYAPKSKLLKIPPFQKGKLSTTLSRGGDSFYNEFREGPFWLTIAIIFSWCVLYEGLGRNKEHSRKN